MRKLFLNDSFNNSKIETKLSKVICQIPFNEFHIYRDGYVSNCCFNWLPTEVGNIHQNSLLEILKSKIQIEIQNSVQNGKYNFCSSDYCPFLNNYANTNHHDWPLASHDDFKKIHSDHLIKNIKIFLSFDYSCNLFCESCRNEKIYFDKTTAPELLLKTYDRVNEQIQELVQAGYNLEINVTGSGDAFASPLYYEFMKNLPETDQITLHLSTNGLMMTEKKLDVSFKNKIKKIFISIDSCTDEIYAKVRRGGQFKYLAANLFALDKMISDGKLPNLDCVQYNFIVQTENYQEMGDFVDWCYQFKNFQNIFFTKILDWQHLTKEQFFKKEIWNVQHPEHQNFLKVMTDHRLEKNKVSLGNLSEYRNR